MKESFGFGGPDTRTWNPTLKALIGQRQRSTRSLARRHGDSSLMFGFGRVGSSNPHDQGLLGWGVVLYATVADNEDIDTYFQRVRDAGATVVQEPTDQFWGHRDWGITDPDGYLLFISKETQAVSADAMREAALAGSPA